LPPLEGRTRPDGWIVYGQYKAAGNMNLRGLRNAGPLDGVYTGTHGVQLRAVQERSVEPACVIEAGQHVYYRGDV